MELLVQRGQKDAKAIPGELFNATNGAQHIGWTLERPGVEISTGRKQVLLRFSPHFNRAMPWIQEPGRTNILLHWGDWPWDSDGCILVGETESKDAIWFTQAEFERIFPLIESAVEEGGCWITIKDPVPSIGWLSYT